MPFRKTSNVSSAGQACNTTSSAPEQATAAAGRTDHAHGVPRAVHPHPVNGTGEVAQVRAGAGPQANGVANAARAAGGHPGRQANQMPNEYDARLLRDLIRAAREQVMQIDQQEFSRLQRQPPGTISKLRLQDAAVRSFDANSNINVLEGMSTKDRMQLLSKQNEMGAAFLQRVAHCRSKAIVKALLKGFTPTDCMELFCQGNKNKITVWMLAVQAGNWVMVKLLLASLPYPLTQEQRIELLGAKDVAGLTVLSNAVRNGNLDIIEALLQGLDQDKRIELLKVKSNYNVTALQIAACLGRVSIVRALLNDLSQKQRLELIKEKDHFDSTTLLYAVIRGHEGIVRTFLESMPTDTADDLKSLAEILNMKNKAGATAVVAAAETGHAGIIRMLLEKAAPLQNYARPDDLD